MEYNHFINYQKAINWFEIGPKDIELARKFYEEILHIKLTLMDFSNIKMRLSRIRSYCLMIDSEGNENTLPSVS